jgi:rhodanese-related sulfurtransferase
MRTSDPSIWAVGDAVEVRDLVRDQPALVPLAGPANRQGRIAADSILGREARYTSTQGTAICKVFDLAFAMTGASEKALERAAIGYRRVYVHPADHATYYPGAQPISLKLLFAPDDGRILGAQAVGRSGVDKRIDVIATALRAGLTVYDLEDAELCYAPPFGSAKDPVNMAGFVAANVLRGDVSLWEPEELASLRPDQALVDVRTAPEFAAGTIPGALNVSLDDLRQALDRLPRDKELLVFCQVGFRGYVAARLLSQRGFRVRNLSGGWKRYEMWRGTAAGRAAAIANEDGSPDAAEVATSGR